LRALQLPGAAAERRARRHYRLRGYRVLGANVRLAGVEVDLICRRGSTVVFCEVKEKTTERFGNPLEMVDERKQQRLKRAAELWLAIERSQRCELRFDVVSVRPGKLERIERAF
jgi:putative endonuclease